MLDFGFSEVVVTSMIALVVLGPKRLPGVMRRIGNWVGRARVMARQLTDQLEREINAEEILQQNAKNTASAPAPPAIPPTPALPPAPAVPPAPDALPASVAPPPAVSAIAPARSVSREPQAPAEAAHSVNTPHE
jgi:sec-independent protein translocase protein TatB